MQPYEGEQVDKSMQCSVFFKVYMKSLWLKKSYSQTLTTLCHKNEKKIFGQFFCVHIKK